LSRGTTSFAWLQVNADGEEDEGLSLATAGAGGLVEFVTPDGHLRHARFVALRGHKQPPDVPGVMQFVFLPRLPRRLAAPQGKTTVTQAVVERQTQLR
jgi:hypothetical protein